jgi:hypothetical protein
MNIRSQLLMKAREAGRAGKPCPTEQGDVTADGLAIFNAWLMALTEHETGASILPQETNANDHPDLRICRKEEAL